MLKDLRKKHNLSQKELADVMNVAPSTISMYEKDKRSPNDKTLRAFATYFDVSTDYLLGHIRKNDTDKDDMNEYLEKLRSEPKIRVLFDIASRATKEQLNAAITFMEIMEKQ